MIRADEVESVTARPAGLNLRAARKLLRSLARQERLDDVAAALGQLMVTSAELADMVSLDTPENDVPIYARSKVLSGHAAMLGQLHQMVGPVVEDSAFDRLMTEIATPGPGSNDGNRWG
jgi:hypothetical protein